MTMFHETTEQMRARAMLESLLTVFAVAGGGLRRNVAHEIRELACIAPWLADQIPDDLWNQIYRVRVTGTKAPYVGKPAGSLT